MMNNSRCRGAVIWSQWHKLRPSRALKSTFSSPQHQLHLQDYTTRSSGSYPLDILVPRTSSRSEGHHSAPQTRPSDRGSGHPLFKYQAPKGEHHHHLQPPSSSTRFHLSACTKSQSSTSEQPMASNAPLKPLVAADDAARAENVSQVRLFFIQRRAIHSYSLCPTDDHAVRWPKSLPLSAHRRRRMRSRWPRCRPRTRQSRTPNHYLGRCSSYWRSRRWYPS